MMSIIFTLDARAELTDEEQAAVKKIQDGRYDPLLKGRPAAGRQQYFGRCAPHFLPYDEPQN